MYGEFTKVSVHHLYAGVGLYVGRVLMIDRKNMADCFLPDIKSTRTCTEAIDKYLRKFVVNKDYRSACRFTAQSFTHTRRSTVIDYVCLFFTCLSARVSIRPNLKLAKFLCMLPVAVARSSSDSIVIRYVLPVSWLTSCFHTVGSVVRRVYT